MRVDPSGLSHNSDRSSIANAAAPASVPGSDVRDCQIFWEVCTWQLSLLHTSSTIVCQYHTLPTFVRTPPPLYNCDPESDPDPESDTDLS